jgi:glucokinase
MRIGIDIGASYIKAGLLWEGKVSKFVRLPTGKTKQEFLDRLVEIIRGMSGGNAIGIGIGCPGPANYKMGVIHDTVNLPLKEFNIKQYLRGFFKTDIIMENDAVAFALGEAIYGAGIGKRMIVGITLGTGVGGGIVLDRKPLLGQGNAGHVSMMVLRNEPSADKFFKYKTFETMCSERGLIARAKGFKTGLEMAEAARKGNAGAIAAFNAYGHDLGLWIGSVIGVLDPDVVVVGGGLAQNWEFFQDEMRKAILEVTPFKAEVVKQENEHSVVLGAASLIE